MAGFRSSGSHLTSYDGKSKTYTVAASHATRISIGDVVRITATADALGTQQVDTATASQAISGIVVGVLPNFTTENFTDTGLAASVAGSLLVNTDPRAEYQVDVANGPLVLTDVGLNIDLLAAAASLSGALTISNMLVNASNKGTTSTLPFRVLQLLTDSNGVFGGRCLARMNETTNIAGATGV